MEVTIMKTTRIITTGALGALSLAAATSFAATPGQGYDAFGARDLGSGVGQNITTSTYMGTAMSGVPGKGWDSFAASEGERVPDGRSGYIGTSMQTPSLGYDLLGSKDPSL